MAAGAGYGRACTAAFLLIGLIDFHLARLCARVFPHFAEKEEKVVLFSTIWRSCRRRAIPRTPKTLQKVPLSLEKRENVGKTGLILQMLASWRWVS